MFCSNCGSKINDNSKFCMNCGSKTYKAENNVNVSTGTKFVSAKCTSCGANVNVNPDNKIVQCPYCGNNYIVEKAINTFNVDNGNININNATINVIITPDKQNSQNRERDPLFVDAGLMIIKKQKASIGMLQRVFKIGFNRASRIMDQLCEAGVVCSEDGTSPRKVLMNISEFNSYLNK